MRVFRYLLSFCFEVQIFEDFQNTYLKLFGRVFVMKNKIELIFFKHNYQ